MRYESGNKSDLFRQVKNHCTKEREETVMKKRILAFLSLATVLFAGIGPVQTAQASDVDTHFELPSTFSANVTISEIESALNAYITENDLNIEVGTSEYIEFLANLSMTNEYPNMDETQLRYFRAYASVYLSNANAQSENTSAVSLLTNDSDKTIAEIKQENIELAQALEQHQPIQQRQTREAYNLVSATEYARKYAIIPDLSYRVYKSDCTNFASHILREGGFSPNPDWHYDGDLYPMGNLVWIQAPGFVQYWSLIRGYLGEVCTSASQVNAYTDKGDFLVWMNIDTNEWYHTQFVQSKDMMGEAYCTQHTPNYFNVNFNSRVDSTTFNTNHVYIVDMAL